MKMRRLILIIPLLLSVIGLTGCPPEQDARDAIAAAHGYITSAQAQWTDSCQRDTAQLKCVSTNKLIAAQHVAADALAVYCGPVYSTAGGACMPVKSAQGALYSAIANMNAIAADVSALLKKEGK